MPIWGDKSVGNITNISVPATGKVKITFSQLIFAYNGLTTQMALPLFSLTAARAVSYTHLDVYKRQSQRLLRAQMARGADFEGGFFSRARKFAPLMVQMCIRDSNNPGGYFIYSF